MAAGRDGDPAALARDSPHGTRWPASSRWAARARSRSPAGGWRIGALAVEARDTTGAGDAFVGVLAAALDRGQALPRGAPPGERRRGSRLHQDRRPTSQPDAVAIAARVASSPRPRRSPEAGAARDKEVHDALAALPSPPWRRSSRRSRRQVPLAFCGFYVAKADTELFNQASKVVFARHDGKSVLTYGQRLPGGAAGVRARGAGAERARARPDPRHRQCAGRPPRRLHRTAPRRVLRRGPLPGAATRCGHRAAVPARSSCGAAALGVTIEAQYTVGEYDIVILSAEQSEGLLTWLQQEGYRLPDGAGPVLAGYLAAGMKFFLAKVNLEEQSKLGFSFLRPLQIAFEAEHFMLPIRLGMLNAAGPQELFVFLLTRGGGSRAPTTARSRSRPTSRCRSSSRPSSALLQRDVRRRGRAREPCRRCSSNMPGT